MAIRVPIVSEFNKSGLTDAEKALQRFGVKSTAELKKAAVGFGALAAAGFAAFKSLDAGYDAIVVATGATGDALQGLKDDAKAVAREVPNSFEDVGVAIGEVNTRLGLTGKPLREITEQFLTLSHITGTDVATNVANVTRVFGDWSIATGDQSAAMDKLFEVTKDTGITLDRLTTLTVQYGAPLRQLGFDFEDSIAIFGKWEKEGVNVETVMGGMRIALGKMAQKGKEPVAAFKQLVEQIKNAGTTGEANAIALEGFGQRAGPDMAAAIREGRFEIDDLVASLGNSEGAIGSAADEARSFTDSFNQLRNQLVVAAEPAIMALADVLDAISATLAVLPDDVVQLGVALGVTAVVARSAASGFAAMGVSAGLASAGMGTLLVTAGAFLGALGAVSAVSAGVKDDTQWLYKDVPLYEKGFQALGRMSYEAFGGTKDASLIWGEYEKEAADAFGTVTSGIYTMDQLKRKLDESKLSLEARNIITVQFRKQLDAQAEAEANLKESIEGNTDATRIHSDVLEKKMSPAADMVADSIEKANEQLERKKAADDLAAEATERHRQELKDFLSAIDQSITSMFDYEKATLGLADAVEGYAEQQKKAAESDGISEAEKRSLREAEISLAEQAYNTSKAYAEEQGAIEGTTQYAQAQRDELVRLADQFPELRDEIRLYIAELDKIPGVKSTQVNLFGQSFGIETTGARPSDPRYGRVFGATGGIVNRPTMAMIGEAGPEAVIPLDKTPGNGPLPRNLGGGSGGVTINVSTLTGQLDQRSIQMILDGLARYERTGGSRWRS